MENKIEQAVVMVISYGMHADLWENYASLDPKLFVGNNIQVTHSLWCVRLSHCIEDNYRLQTKRLTMKDTALSTAERDVASKIR